MGSANPHPSPPHPSPLAPNSQPLIRCARAKLSLGAAAMKRDAWDEARTHLHEACEVRPHSSEAWYAYPYP